MKYKYTILLLALFFGLMSACKAPDSVTEPSSEEELSLLDTFFDQSNVFGESITGFVLYDPETDSLLHNRDGHRFFTPASNTKTLTMYGALKTFQDKLPSLRYEVKDDTLYFRSTGDPTFLNPEFESQEAYEFLKSRDEVLAYYDGHYDDEHFGSGWSWDWYPQAYAPEKSPFPIYGNMMRLQAQQVALVMLNEDEPVKPKFFERYINQKEWDGDQPELVLRSLRDNEISYVPKSDTVRQERNIPFVYDRDLVIEMLTDTLGTQVHHAENPPVSFSETVYGPSADTVYARMHKVSDNFIAEQLMLMISDQEFGTMNTRRAINHVLDTYLDQLPDRPQWSDGSGLTRLNLITPRTMVALLDLFYDDFGEEMMKKVFAAGGESGTIRGSYRPDEGDPSYVYAKTGTLSNTTALSGYVYTDSGKRLIFSFFNNNYVASGNTMRGEMEKTLRLIKENY
ncbi:MAG: D-alanyl-D-alanine carboxypeptidase [Balneolaceae bacterium]